VLPILSASSTTRLSICGKNRREIGRCRDGRSSTTWRLAERSFEEVDPIGGVRCAAQPGLSRRRLLRRTDVERFLLEFRERLAKFGLELHADKTRLIEFGRFAARDRKQRRAAKPETFTFLGFSHFCGQLTTGAFIVWGITAKKRMVAKLKAIKAAIRDGRSYRDSDSVSFRLMPVRSQFTEANSRKQTSPRGTNWLSCPYRRLWELYWQTSAIPSAF
jgi:hypothetical protein